MTDLLFMPGMSVLLGSAGRATIVLVVALTLAWLMRRAPAAARHELWTLAFVLLLALPVLTLIGPSWDLPLLPASDRAHGLPSVEVQGEALSGDAAGRAASSGSFDAGTTASLANEAPGRLGLNSVPVLLWAMGCGAALVSLGVGMIRFRKLVHGAQPVRDPAWLEALEAAEKELGFRADARLLASAEVVTPMTGGLRSPVILLPASATGWSAARRTVVLRHELIHVRRRDALRQLLGRTVLALYWFHPLSWLAARLAAASREEACDEEVLAGGTRPSEYAKHLLGFAANSGQGRAHLALSIVHPSRLERRIRAILRFNRPRSHRLLTAVALTAFGAVGVSASCANPVPVEIGPPGSRASTAAHFDRDCTFVTAEKKWRWSSKRAIPGKRAIPEGILCMGVKGDVVVSHDALEVRAIGPGGSVALESVGRRSHVLEITEGSGGLEYDWRIDGQKREFDEEAQQWRDLMLAMHLSQSWGLAGFWGPDGGPHGRVHLNQAVAGMRGEEATLRREVAELLGQMATYRADELSLRSALMAASNTRTRVALEMEIEERTERARELDGRIEKLDLSAIEAEIQYQIETHRTERDVRDLATALGDPEAYLLAEARVFKQEAEIAALRELINR